jgi:hypothetical protein
VGRLSLVADGSENTVAANGGASQYVAVQALVCFSAVMGNICLSVVASLIHLSRSLVWGCGRDQTFDTRVGYIRMQLCCEHPCALMRKAIQYYDCHTVWFGTRGVVAKPPIMEGLLRSIPRSLGGSTDWLYGCSKSGWVHARVDSPLVLSSADPAPVHPWRGSFRDACQIMFYFFQPLRVQGGDVH